MSLKSLDALRDVAAENSSLLQYIVRLDMIRHQIEEECPDSVLWAAAFGRFLSLFREKERRQAAARNGVEFLAVTSERNLYKAHVDLAEKVFGPVFLEFGRLPNYHVWTVKEFKAAAESNNAIYRRAISEGVSIYGTPDAIRERAGVS
jgi:hypothetical protein